jgi:hypothetical protein
MRNGDLHFRSRCAGLDGETTNKLFFPTVDHIQSVGHLLQEGWTYRGEAFKGPKHNTKTYHRAPAGNLVLFDVETLPGKFMDPANVRDIAAHLEVEPVRTIFEGTRLQETEEFVPWSVWLEGLLEQDSTLEGTQLEGIVIKAYDKLTRLGQVMMAKIVSPEFREAHKSNKTFMRGTNYAAALASDYRTEPRWRKAVQHLRDNGELSNSQRDIGPLLKELQTDFEQECAGDVGRQLWEHYRKTILKGIGSGFPEWYKAELRREHALNEGNGESVSGEDTGEEPTA